MDKLDKPNKSTTPEVVPAFTHRQGQPQGIEKALQAAENAVEELSAYQIEALKTLAVLPSLPETKEELIKVLGVTKPTWYAWLRLRPFRLVLNEIAAARVADDALWISEAMALKARGGDVGAARVYFTLTGWDRNRNQRGGDMNVLISFGDSG